MTSSTFKVSKMLIVSLMLFHFILNLPLAISAPENLKRKISSSWSSSTPLAQDLIESIEAADRGLFVAFHLSKALNNVKAFPKYMIRLPKEAKIPHDKYEKFKEIRTYPKFPIDLLNWTKTTFNITNSDVYSLVTTLSRVCFAGRCFDTNDIGSLCCPF